ncbi:MAG: carbohydrate binding domain-containing protein, partial [Bacteroidota bacterium]
QIYLDNSSFEGPADDATMPTGWHACKEGTTPDIMPGPWGVTKEAYEGETYLGLITRENGTWESIEQRLSSPMKYGNCYTFSLWLAHTRKYAGYNLPLKLRIWGSGEKCDRAQLLAETKFVKHQDWRKYEFEFYPKNTINYLVFEAHFADGVYISYKGNILLDDLSEISICKRAALSVAD